MRRPNQEDGETFRATFDDWVSVEIAQSLSDDFLANHGSYARGLRTGKFWRECFHALKFASKLDVTHLKAGDDPPDFMFRTLTREMKVELVVARDVDDLTSQEFLDDIEFVGPWPIEQTGQIELDKSWNTLPSRIAKQVSKKARKHYSLDTHLAVAASSYWWDSDEAEMESSIRLECGSFLESFATVWVLAGGHLIEMSSASPRT